MTQGSNKGCTCNEERKDAHGTATFERVKQDGKIAIFCNVSAHKNLKKRHTGGRRNRGEEKTADPTKCGNEGAIRRRWGACVASTFWYVMWPCRKHASLPNDLATDFAKAHHLRNKRTLLAAFQLTDFMHWWYRSLNSVFTELHSQLSVKQAPIICLWQPTYGRSILCKHNSRFNPDSLVTSVVLSADILQIYLLRCWEEVLHLKFFACTHVPTLLPYAIIKNTALDWSRGGGSHSCIFHRNISEPLTEIKKEKIADPVE